MACEVRENLLAGIGVWLARAKMAPLLVDGGVNASALGAALADAIRAQDCDKTLASSTKSKAGPTSHGGGVITMGDNTMSPFICAE